VRRRAPRPLACALETVARDAAPPGLLARVQSVWEEVAGAAVAAEARPVSERAGTVTVACDSAVWAHELSLLGPELARRLNAVLGEDGAVSLRFRADL
jgi:predicted nucleic acid-binding Zn ribbon protein